MGGSVGGGIGTERPGNENVLVEGAFCDGCAGAGADKPGRGMSSSETDVSRRHTDNSGSHTLLFFIRLLILCHTETLTGGITHMPPIDLLSSGRPRTTPEPNGTISTCGSEDVPKRMIRKGPDDLIVCFLYHCYWFCRL